MELKPWQKALVGAKAWRFWMWLFVASAGCTLGVLAVLLARNLASMWVVLGLLGWSAFSAWLAYINKRVADQGGTLGE